MAFNGLLEMHDEPSIDMDKLSYEIFSILETKFLFGYDNSSKLLIPGQAPAPTAVEPKTEDLSPCNRTEWSSPQSLSEGESPPRIRILSIDGGGGLRGILPCRALAYLEHAIRERSNDPKATIADYFDVVAGTGVGGIVAAMLFATRDGVRPAFEARDVWRLLREQGKWIFNPSGGGGGGFLRRLFGGRGGGEGLEKFLRETFGGGEGALTLKDTLKPVLIPCYDLSTAAPFLFSRADALESEGYNFRLWDVCRATSAEPGLHEPVPMRSVDGKNRCVGMDGGLVMSNPTAAAITHVLHNRKEFPRVRGVDDLLVLSLGTGQVIEVAGDGLEHEDPKGWKAKERARSAVRVTVEESADLVDQAVGMAFGHCRTGSYVRIQANATKLLRDGPNTGMDPDDRKKKLAEMAEQMLKQKNVESVLFGGKKISELTNFEKLDSFASELVLEQQHRRNRSCKSTSSSPCCQTDEQGFTG